MEEDGGEAGDDGKRWLGLECLDGPFVFKQRSILVCKLGGGEEGFGKTRVA